MTRSQAALLLQLAENRFDAGSETINEMRRMGSTHARDLLEDEEMLKKALEINRQDQERFANYFSRPPRQEQGRAAVGQNLSEQRAALTQVRKTE
jgi:hypothetical protein